MATPYWFSKKEINYFLESWRLNVFTPSITRITARTTIASAKINWNIIIFISGLQNISPSMYEAAQMEGCTSWESLWKITVPMISPLLLVNWIYTIIDFFMKSDNELMMKIRNEMVLQLDFGFSSAMAWIYFVACMLIIGISSLIISKVVYNYD